MGIINMDFMKELIEVTKNPYASIVEAGIAAGDIRGYISTGSYMLNGLLGGSLFAGLIDNRITVLAGDPSVGKTYILLDFIKNFLISNPTGTVLLFESESAISKDMLVERGIDVSRVAIFPVVTVQEFRTQIIKIIDMYLKLKPKDRFPLFLGLDSLGMLSTTKEMEDTAEGKETADMTRAKLIKSVFRTITLKLGLAGIPLVVTNHTYDEQGLFAKKVMGGGSGVALASSTTVFLSKRKDKEGTDVVGNYITCTLRKARVTKENSICEIYLSYTKGMHPYHGLLDLGVKYGIFTKVGNKFNLNPESEEKELHFEKKIMKNPTKFFTTEIMLKLDDAAKKEFCYGSEEATYTEDDTTDTTEENE